MNEGDQVKEPNRDPSRNELLANTIDFFDGYYGHRNVPDHVRISRNLLVAIEALIGTIAGGKFSAQKLQESLSLARKELEPHAYVPAQSPFLPDYIEEILEDGIRNREDLPPLRNTADNPR